MAGEGLFSIMDISSSALIAERIRMNIIANNIANANTTNAGDGKPFRRRVVVYEPKFQNELKNSERGSGQLGGVQVKEIKMSKEPFPSVYNPGHPDADKNGIVLNTNVNGTTEMVDMMTASRAYEANLAIMRSAQRMVNRTLRAFNR